MPRKPSPPSRRRVVAPEPVAELARRVAALEERLTRLEDGKAPPGDGRAASRERSSAVTRCPGCGLPLRRRAGRCAACGRPLDA